MKFCSFCGEAHEEITKTCSEECADELIKHEFAEACDITATCLWCPARGDKFKFKTKHCCFSCYQARRTHGACDRCGGPLDVKNLCACCDPILERVRSRCAEVSMKALLLVDLKRQRARSVAVSRIYGVPQDRVPILYVDRYEFAKGISSIRAATIKAAPKLKVEFFRRVQKPGLMRETTRSMLKIWGDVGTGSTKHDFLDRFPGDNLEAKDRKFERYKQQFRDMGLKMTYVPDGFHGEYLFSPNKIRDMLTYIYTLEHNVELGYHWK